MNVPFNGNGLNISFNFQRSYGGNVQLNNTPKKKKKIAKFAIADKEGHLSASTICDTEEKLMIMKRNFTQDHKKYKGLVSKLQFDIFADSHFSYYLALSLFQFSQKACFK